MYSENEVNLIVLDSFTELSYKAKREFLYSAGGNRPDFTKFGRVLIKSVPCGVYNKLRDKFFDVGYRDRVLKSLERKGVKCVTVLSREYPDCLKEIPDPPLVLYCKGNCELLSSRRFAVVGSRRTPQTAYAACKKICSELCSAFTVVTGSADGADSAAIEGAIGSGKIISVLAHGFDYAYPACNGRLIESVAKSGLILSEYPPETEPRSYLFPLRNRIIAGLCEGALIASAAKKSGALITAGYCEEYGRKVFAFPHSVGVLQGEGCNELIKKGAYLTENILDIFSVFGLDLNLPKKESLTETESEVYEIIRSNGEAFVPNVAAALKKQPYELIPVLTSLEVKGLVVRLGGNRYSAL